MDLREVMMGTSRQTPQQEENLVNPVKVSSIGPLPRAAGFWWLLGIRSLGILAAFLFGYSYFFSLSHGLSLWYTGIALLFFVAFSVLQMFLSGDATTRSGFLLLEVLALFAPFIIALVSSPFASVMFAQGGGWQFVVGGLVIAFLFLWWGYAAGRSEFIHSTQIRFFRMTHPVASNIVTLALIFMIAWYGVVQVGGGNFFLSAPAFDSLFHDTSSLFNGFYPSIPVNGSFNDFALGVVTTQAEGTPAFNALTPAAQSNTITQNVGLFTDHVSQALNVTITPSTTVSGLVYAFMTSTLADWHDHFGDLFVVLWALALFIIFRSVGVVFVWVAQFLSMLFYEVMLATGVIRIADEPQIREVIEFV